MVTPYFSTPGFHLYHCKCNLLLSGLPSNSVDNIITDPPYFLSGSNYVFKRECKDFVSNKGEWDQAINSDFIDVFNLMWLFECKRLLKLDGSMLVFGTIHNMGSLYYAIKKLDLHIMQDIVWVKPNPTPCFSCRYLIYATEHILWIKKQKNAKHYFDDDYSRTLNEYKQHTNVFKIGKPKKVEMRWGKHPTQKPIELMEILVYMFTPHRALILDPFAGSCTTGIAASLLSRRFIGCDQDSDYLDIGVSRYLTIDEESTNV